MGGASSTCAEIGPRLVCRLVTPVGALFPVQEYLRTEVPPSWTRSRTEAGLFSFDDSEGIARRLTSPEVLVYAAFPQRRSEPVMPARDWHAGKPNCGVD